MVRARHRRTGVEVAVKVVSRKHGRDAVTLNEVAVLTQLRDGGHLEPSLMRYVESFFDAGSVYIVTEYCAGGELLTEVIKLVRIVLTAQWQGCVVPP